MLDKDKIRIISGYQGVGKSTACFDHMYAVDLESSNFFVDGVRPDGWEKIYINIAQSLTSQQYDVFVSCHESVRREIAKRDVDAVVIYPALALKEQWIKRLEDRYNLTKLQKDLNALNNAKQYFDVSISELMEDDTLEKIELTDMDYDLSEMLGLC